MIAAPRFQHLSSGGLALTVHGFFLLALLVSISWKNPPHLPVEADLWAALPESFPAGASPSSEVESPSSESEPLPMPALPPVPEHRPAPTPLPQPPLPQAQPAEAEIALRKAEKEKQRQADEEFRKQEESQRLEAKRQVEERVRQEQEEFERAERVEQERVKREFTRTQVERDMTLQMHSELEREAAQVRAIQELAFRTERRDRQVEDFKRRIQAKVQSYVRLPHRINGNPEAIFQVTLFANGEVRNVTLVKSSGQPAYDVEVERAILKASPLPLPNEKEAATLFRGGLVMKFRPFDGGPGSGGSR